MDFSGRMPVMDKAMTQESNDTAGDPIVLVGLPRSGSTLLTSLLNETSELYLLNDLYYLQKVDAANAWHRLTKEDAESLVSTLEDVIARRSGAHGGRTLANSAPLDPEALRVVQRYLRSDALPRSHWADLLQAALRFAAQQAGKRQWGYNTPQDCLHLERLFEAFPSARIIFLMRDPRAVMRSYKAEPDHENPGLYHPLAQSMAWRAAASAYRQAVQSHPTQVLLVRFEDLVSETAGELARIGDFLGVRPPATELARHGDNSAVASGRTAAPSINDTEQWLSDRIVHDMRRSLGYRYTRTRPRLGDMPGMLATSARFIGVYLGRLATDRDRRKRVYRLLRATLARGHE